MPTEGCRGAEISAKKNWTSQKTWSIFVHQQKRLTNIIFQYVRKHRDKLTELFYNAAL